MSELDRYDDKMRDEGRVMRLMGEFDMVRPRIYDVVECVLMSIGGILLGIVISAAAVSIWMMMSP